MKGDQKRRNPVEEQQFRNKIQWFTFCSSLLVVWGHALNAELFLGNSPAAARLGQVERFLGNEIGQLAVPSFFMISAYLFYRNFNWSRLRGKWKSRCQSLVVPFLLWNGIYYLGYILASRIGGLTDVVGKGIIPVDWNNLFQAVFHYRYNYVFWYLYQLIWLVALTPVIYALLKRKETAALYLAIVSGLVWTAANIPVINEDSLLYYSTAGYFAIHEKKKAEGARSSWHIRTGTAFVIAGLLCRILYGQTGAVGLLVLFRLSVPLGVWALVDQSRLWPVKAWMKDTFFLYAVHFAVVRLVNKTAAFLFPGDFLIAVFLFLAMPLLCVMLSVLAGKVMKTRVPFLWHLLTGGRNY